MLTKQFLVGDESALVGASNPCRPAQGQESRANCRECGKCACTRCHPEPHVNVGRRIFLLGALAAPLVKLPAIVAPPAPVVLCAVDWRVLKMFVDGAWAISPGIAWRADGLVRLP